MKAAIIFGSKSDTEKMRGAAKCFKEFGVEYEAHILSAHRVPEKLEEVLENLEKKDIYKCIKDRHESFDRQAMIIASENLGHSRETVIAGHYLLGD